MYLINGSYGICTDIVNACIDPTDITLIPEERYISSSMERSILITPFEQSEVDVMTMIADVSHKYKSLETWLTQKAIEPRTKIHNYIYVDGTSDRALEWMKERWQVLHEEGLPDYYDELKFKRNAVVSRHYADLVITIDDILDGKMIEQLSTIISEPLDVKLYKSWLTLVKYDYPW